MSRYTHKMAIVLWPYIVYGTPYMCTLLADMSVVVKLSIGNDKTALRYAHTFSLLSPTFPSVRTASCLSLDYMSEAEFTVRLVCLSDNEVHDDVLRRSTFPLGFSLHRMNLVVAGRSVPDETCRFIFDIESWESGVLAAISNINLTEGACEYEGNVRQNSTKSPQTLACYNITLTYVNRFR